MNTKIIRALYKKEILDILRDKKTILMMIVVPLILYPLLFLGSMWMMTNIMTSDTRDAFVVALYELPEEKEITEFIAEKQKEYNYQFVFLEEASNHTIEELFQNKKVNAVLCLADQVPIDAADHEILVEEAVSTLDETVHYSILYNSSSNASMTAAGMLEDMLVEYRQKLREDRFEENNLPVDYYLYPLQYERTDIATNEETVGNLFGYILPFLMVTSILMGSMYPAIDTTAGERERGTLETILTLPVSNLELITGKFLATSTVAVGAAFLNVLSMGILGGYFYSGLQLGAGDAMTFRLSAYLPSVFLTLLCAVIFALFSSAVCLCVCIYAKTFKEAQNYTTPVMLVFMIASMCSIMPELSLQGGLLFVPVVNLVLLISELFRFQFDMQNIASVLLLNISYSILAILLMAKLFDSEAILFGESNSGIQLLEKRSLMKKKQLPGMGDVFLLLAVLMIVLLMAGSMLVAKLELWGMILQQLLILGLTLGYCTYIKVDLRHLFSIKMPKIKHGCSAVFGWVGIYFVMMLLSGIMMQFFPESGQQAEDALLNLWDGQPLLFVLISTALLPAICEEFVFRGFLFGTLKEKYSPVFAVLASGLLFGLYHMNLVKAVVVGVLGCFLAYMVLKTRSIWISIGIHFLNNAFSVLLSMKPDFMKRILPVLYKEELAMGDLAVTGVVAILCIGICGLLLKDKKNVNQE